MDLDETFEERSFMSKEVVKVLDDWRWNMTLGIKVHRYEIKNIIPPRYRSKCDGTPDDG